MKISIVTVCYNSEAVIEKTIKSVLGQTYRDTEYIIVDGASKDKTMEVINRYRMENDITVISEPDKGLYDAMNKGIKMAHGDYIIFMNSGDEFESADTLSKVVEMTGADASWDIIFGDVRRDKREGTVTETCSDGRAALLKMFLTGRMMCHQSMLIRTDKMRKYGYDTSYSITADYDMVVRMFSDKCSFRHVDLVISHVEGIEGISSRPDNLGAMQEQDDRSLRVNIPFFYYITIIPKRIYRKLKYRG
ncbi:MAG: glycosyltransferase [Lachnospiraceae bacterium]|nr:glycosyltransferase [Lachnospiraceae bacterium]